MTTLVTGGTGLVGRAICGGLAARGWRVICADLSLNSLPGVESHVADMRVREAIYPLLKGVEAVVHLANHSNQWRADAQTVVAENTAMNTNVFHAAAECGVRRVVFSSSVQVASGLPLDAGACSAPPAPPQYPLSGDSLPRPGNAYAASKTMGEQLLRYLAVIHGLEATALRLPFIVSGRNGLERQAAKMSAGTWPYEGFAWLWAGDLPGLIAEVLTTAGSGYRCLLPSAPPMLEFPAVRAAVLAHPEARIAEKGRAGLAGWSPTPLAAMPPEPAA